jgi:DNA invertase Pin-like site-specific DNA recombinase
VRKAYSYARFSTSEHSEGRSLARQLEAARRYCDRHDLTLEDRTFTDEGVSGYHGGNATHGQLADFLTLVSDGRIPRGSVLIIENVDRLSRLPPDEATALFMSIVKAGVDIATISPEQRYTKTSIHQTGVWVPLQVALCLASEESRKKGERLADAWREKRDMAAERKLSKTCPFWLRLSADRSHFIVLEGKARMVRDIFAWSLEGLGVARICALLQERHPEGPTGRGWQPAGVREVLRNKAAIGEFQPHVGTCAKKGVKKTRRPQGEPIKGYFPAVVDEGDFYRVQLGMDGRRKGGGRMTGTPNLFNGYAYDAHDGHRMVLNANNRRKVLVSGGAARKLPGCEYRAVPYLEFEGVILERLTELKASDVAGPRNGAQAELQAASDRLTAINHKIGQTQQRAAGADDPTVYLDLLDELARQRKQAVAALEAAKAKAATEAGDTLGECQSVIRLLRDAAPSERDELRRKVRAAMGRLIESVYVLPVRRSRLVLLAAAQVWFREGEGRHRDYLMVIGKPGGEPAAVALPPQFGTDLDLRQKTHAARLERALLAAEIPAE